VPYTYYEESAFNVSRIHPLGGPDGGGTQVSVLPYPYPYAYA
jgi:hypothetical protein